MTQAFRFLSRSCSLFSLLLLPLVAASTASAQPTFTKTFTPDAIGPGSVSTLTFTITNGGVSPVTDLAFTDILPTMPGDVDIATPASASTDCLNGVVTAPDGGGTITFSNGSLGGGASCTISVDVTANTPGLHSNTSGDLTSSAGNSGTASDDLTVATTLPGFSKSFSPSTVSFGSRSTLTFTIDNSANPGFVFSANFTDVLPTGMVVADPSNGFTDCTGAPLTAIPGTGVIALVFSGIIASGSTCTVSVDVIAGISGQLDNISGELNSTNSSIVTLSSGKASAALDVTVTPIALRKSFTDDPVPPGGAVTLDFTIDNFDRDFAATDIAFSDDLTTLVPALAGLTFSSLLSNDCGGSVTGVGGSTIGFTGGTLGAEGSCTLSVSLAVPAATAPGIYTNTTGMITGTIDGSPVVGNMASDDLFVFAAPVLTKTFLVDPVAAGGTTTIEFTITNTSQTSMATDIAFLDELTTFLPVPVSVTLPPTPDPPCGAGSSMVLVFIDSEPDRQGLSLSGGTLAAAGASGDSCTFTVDLDIPVDIPNGIYVNTTGVITATVDAATVTGSPASDDFEVVSAPSLSKVFTDDPVVPGATVTLEFTLNHDAQASTDATNIAFSDDLNATLTGLVATGLPMNDTCGTGSMISGTTVLSFTGGTLVPGAACTFSVTLQVPASAAGGFHTNTTSAVSATVGGLMTSGTGGEDDLIVSGLSFTKEFIDDPLIPGGIGTLRFTLMNDASSPAVGGIVFLDNLAADLPGLTAVTPPPTPCGGSLVGTTFLIFSGGSLMPGEICTFDVSVMVPGGAADGSYLNITSNLTVATPVAAILPPATDLLVVDGNLLDLTKSFIDDPVEPGGTVTLEFTLTNLDPLGAASGIAFTDNLDAALTGLVATGLPIAACGGLVDAIPDAGTIDFSGGSLAGGAMCNFSVTLQVPVAVPLGTTVTNTTSSLTGTIGVLPVVGDPATDDLVINFLSFTKVFDGPSVVGGTPTLTFTIENLSGSTAVSGISFTDDLDAVLTGLIATGTPISDGCGMGSVLSGTSFLTLTGGSLDPGTMCVLNVPLLVPGGATAGTYANTTSDLLLSGLPVAAPATADLVIEPPPTFAKSFTPDTIAQGGTSALRFDIDNSASIFAANNLDFADNLPPGVEIANPPNTSVTCSGGTLTANVGASIITYTGGSVGAASSCSIEVSVTAPGSGTFVNTTGDLTSSSGNSGTANATLTTTGDLLFTKTFLAGPILPGGSIDLEFTITNNSAVPLTGITFTDDLDAMIPGLVATGLPTMDVCGAGSQLSGPSILTLSGGGLGPNTSCTFSVTLVIPGGTALGVYTNVSSNVTAMAGGGSVTGNAAMADLEVLFLDFEKFFGGNVSPGDTTVLTFVITNPDPVNPATAITFTDDLNAVIPGLMALDPPQNDICGLGSMLSGASLLTFANGSLAPGATCMFTVEVEIPTNSPAGVFTNLTSELEATVGGSVVTGGPAGIAAANLAVGASIPTLGSWGLFFLAGALVLLGLWMVRRAPLAGRP